MRPGDVPQGIHHLEKGYARLYSLSPEGKELTLVIYKPGDFFPVVWTFTGKTSIYYVDTLSDVILRRAPREKFMELIKEDADVFFRVTLDIIKRFQESLKRMEHLVFGNSSSRLASVLLICAERFGIQNNKSGTRIPIPFTHKEIADLVGLARETVSIEIKKFKDEGIIGYKGRFIVIKNERRLQRKATLV